MILTTEQYKLLSSYIGYGVVEHPLICFFGNESGTGGMSVDKYIPKFIKDLELIQNDTLNKIDDLPVSSIFLQFISRLMLAIEYSDESWFGELSGSGKAFVNNYIMNRFCKENTCVFNLRPLPRPTERIWPYDNIIEKDYIKNYNFMLKHSRSDVFKEIRMNALKTGFEKIKGALIIGVGDKENKKAFFETLYNCKFETLEIGYYNKEHNIILTNYFDNKHGIKLEGLKTLYHFIISL